MDIKVSILIPIYKAEKYIEECLCSVFEQTYDNIEFILVNDASPDNSMTIVNRTINNYPKRKKSVTIIENDQNIGVAKTRNELLYNATGDYIYFVDSDDFIKPDTIETLVQIVKEKKADIVRCNYNKYINGTVNAIIRTPMKEDDDYIKNCLDNDNGLSSLCLLLVRKDLFSNNNLTFIEDINGCEDFLMSVKLFYYAKRIIDTPEPFYYYRLDNSSSITHNEMLFRNNSCKAVEEIVNFLKEKGIYTHYKNEVIHLMFASKQKFLINKAIRDIDKYIYTFPEANNCYKYYDYSLKENILFFLAEHKYRFLLKLFC